MSSTPTVNTLINSSNCFIYGNSSTGNALSVQQVGVGNVFAFSNASGGSNVMVMTNLGRVGIGTASPSMGVSIYQPFYDSGTAAATIYDAFSFDSAQNSNSKVVLCYGSTSSTGGGVSGGGVFAIKTRPQSAFGVTAPIERLRITDAGNVGIGTASPGNLLEIYGSNPTLSVGTSTAVYNGGNSTLLFNSVYTGGGNAKIVATDIASSPNAYQGRLDFYAQYNVGLRLGMSILGTSATGCNVGIGTTNPSAGGTNSLAGALLDVYASGTGVSSNVNISAGCDGNASGSNKASVIFNIKGSGGGIVNGGITHQLFSAAGQYGFNFQPGAIGTSVMSILGSGNVGIGTTSPAVPLHIVGVAAKLYIDSTTSGDAGINYFQDGVVKTYSGWSRAGSYWYIGVSNDCIRLYSGETAPRIPALIGVGNRAVYSDANGLLTNTSSDARLKSNVHDINYGISTVQNLRPVSYNWSNVQTLGTQLEIGFIAQEVQKLVPEVIGQNSDGMLSLDYPKLTAVLTKAVQELSTENTALKQSLATATANISSLKSCLDSLEARLAAAGL